MSASPNLTPSYGTATAVADLGSPACSTGRLGTATFQEGPPTGVLSKPKAPQSATSRHGFRTSARRSRATAAST